MSDPFTELRDVMARLRDPDHGCPWDLEQDFRTIAPYTIEEAYEVADAIERDAMDELRGELGDLLFQVYFHARMAEERGLFDVEDVARAIAGKLVRRHPHVFGDREVASREELRHHWERDKLAEAGESASALGGVGRALPALIRAAKLQRRASAVGFDWPGPAPVLDKVHEEVGELEHAIRERDHDAREEEVGDLLFAVVNLARHLEVEPEAALRRACGKFERRFRGVESLARQSGARPSDLTLSVLDELWERVKRDERGGDDSREPGD